VVGRLAPGFLGTGASRWSRVVALVLVMLVVPGARSSAAHPLHTTLTELTYDPSSRTVSILLRVFADDFAAAVQSRGPALAADVMPPDSAMLRYVSERLTLTVGGVGRATMRWCGSRRDGAALFLCLRATIPTSLAGARLGNTLLSEKFADQVNIVQANVDGRRRTLLFTPRDGAKALQ